MNRIMKFIIRCFDPTWVFSDDDTDDYAGPEELIEIRR